ncbi:hypothetical protein [Clostridium chrysemydis]|uniref:hypothetical protein n=1 Tax=Clostridium chrysemydis TaxID=2665504 RepID=UPI001883F790|nr:hypothetical protein [Clostridium chrysemydis]
MDSLLNQVCTVKRANIFGAKNHSKKYYVDLYEDEIVGTYPCRIVRKSAKTSSNQVESTVQGTMRAYFNNEADVEEGDIIECSEYSQYTFNVLFVYNPGFHHKEVDLEIVPKSV